MLFRKTGAWGGQLSYRPHFFPLNHPTHTPTTKHSWLEPSSFGYESQALLRSQLIPTCTLGEMLGRTQHFRGRARTSLAHRRPWEEADPSHFLLTSQPQWSDHCHCPILPGST